MSVQENFEAYGQTRLFSDRSCSKILSPPPARRPRQGPPNGNALLSYNPFSFEQPYALKLHRASRHHLDLRLCYQWIALSWAIHAMPSHCPDQSCVAVQVEDHLRDNLLFEGVHPEGEKGAGPTIVVDMGVWQPLAESLDVEAGLHDGYLQFAFTGGKLLRGVWSLTRIRDCYRQENPRWVLAKDEDEFAVETDAAGMAEWKGLRSCCTGLTLEEEESNFHLGIQRFRHGDSLPFSENP
ncbi:MAG TPA: DNA polymerase ligase N-terminal domain-containing protein [Acidobacteriaceae bacterium]|nr:DNA polymerase ligase N-terminal domain-containing protein [Acidobacteriaceae bacterium]